MNREALVGLCIVALVIACAFFVLEVTAQRRAPWRLEATEDSTGAVCYAYTRGTELRPAGCLWTLDRPAQ